MSRRRSNATRVSACFFFVTFVVCVGGLSDPEMSPIQEEGGTSPINIFSVSVVPNHGIAGIGDTVSAVIVASQEGLAVNEEACSINGKQVAKSFRDEGSGTYKLTYIVEENDNDRSEGSLPISCELHVKTEQEVILEENERGSENIVKGKKRDSEGNSNDGSSDTASGASEKESDDASSVASAASSPNTAKRAITRIFKFTETNTLAVDARRPNLNKASIVRVIPKSPVGIGGMVVIKIEGSASDEGLVLGDCRANIPMAWTSDDETKRKAVVSFSQQQSKSRETERKKKAEEEQEAKRPNTADEKIDASRSVDAVVRPGVRGLRDDDDEVDEGSITSTSFFAMGTRQRRRSEKARRDVALPVDDTRDSAVEGDVDVDTSFRVAESIGGQQVTGFMEIGRGLYIVEYVVAENDFDHPEGQLPFVCTLLDKASNAATIGPMKLYRSDLVIDAHAPEITATRLHYASSSPAVMGTNITIAIVATEIGLNVKSCLLDNFDATSSHSRDRDLALDPTGVSYFFSWSVPSSQGDWAPGKMPIDCVLSDAAGNEKRVTAFTDQNTLAGRTQSPGLMDYVPNLALVVRFVLVAVAANTVGQIAPHFGLPKITGFLVMGIVAGPFMLQLIPESDIRSLRFVDEISLAFISFSAGGKLHLNQLQARFRSVIYVTLGLVVFEYLIGSATVVLLAPHIHFMEGMDTYQCVAVGLMAGALVIARSPASAIAIVRELGCEGGRFTQLVLGVTVIMDLVVIALFALTSLVSNALLSKTQQVGAVLGVFVVQVGLSTLLGLGLGASLPWVLYRPRGRAAMRLAKICDGALSFCCAKSTHTFTEQFARVYEDEDEDYPFEDREDDDEDDMDDDTFLSVRDKTPLLRSARRRSQRSAWAHQTKTPGSYSRLRWLQKERAHGGRRGYASRPFALRAYVGFMDALLLLTGFASFALAHGVDPLLQPLIICMVAGFVCVNFTRRGDAFLDAEDRIAPLVHVAFFTLTGAALDLESVAPNIALAVIIAIGRVLGIFLGSYSGGRLAGESEFESRRSWMAYVTQAGVALGLAKKVHLEYRVWGGSFATMFVTVVVINQIIGPPLFRYVLRSVENRVFETKTSTFETSPTSTSGGDDSSSPLSSSLRSNNSGMAARRRQKMQDGSSDHESRRSVDEVLERKKTRSAESVDDSCIVEDRRREPREHSDVAARASEVKSGSQKRTQVLDAASRIVPSHRKGNMRRTPEPASLPSSWLCLDDQKNASKATYLSLPRSRMKIAGVAADGSMQGT